MSVRIGKAGPIEHLIEQYALMPDSARGESVEGGRHFFYCPGCGLGLAQNALMHAFDALKLDMSRTVIIAAPGCYAPMGGYFQSHYMHVPHGTTAAAATGMKLANPDLNVVVTMGDGEAMAIGSGAVVNAARRNIDITCIMFNNFGYGDTGGQYAPTTPADTFTETSPYGMPENAIDPCKLAIASGATYVARATVYHSQLMTKFIANAIDHTGFSFVEVLQNCHELFGRRNGMPKASQMITWYKENSVTIAQAQKLSPTELSGRFVIGEFFETDDRPELTAQYDTIIERARAAAAAESDGGGA